MMKIQIGGLSEGVHSYRFQTNAPELGLQGGFKQEVLVVATLDRTSSQILLKAQVQTTSTVSCDRCAGDFECPISASYQMYYVHEGTESSAIDPTEVQLIPSGVGFIDIAEDVRQTVLLGIPLKLLCSENCRGLCPRCGTNLNNESCTCRNDEENSLWEMLRPLRGN